MNTHERSPARALQRLEHSVDSAWWSGSAKVLTFHPAELVATKIRALYQRSKGRDLFDLWLALTEMALPPDEILSSVGPYLPDGLTSAQAIATCAGSSTTPSLPVTWTASSSRFPSATRSRRLQRL